MSRTLTAAEYEANMGLVHKIARGCYARVQAAGVALDYEDVVQEVSLSYVKAWEKFDEARGYQFSTYFVMAAHHDFNRFVAKPVAERLRPWCTKFHRECHGASEACVVDGQRVKKVSNCSMRVSIGVTASIEEFSNRINLTHGAKPDDGDIYEVIPSTQLGPEALYAAKERVERLSGSLSPTAQLVLQWLLEPPPELETELAAARAHVGYAKSKGVVAKSPLEVTIGIIFRFVNLIEPNAINRNEAYQTRRELESVMQELAT